MSIFTTMGVVRPYPHPQEVALLSQANKWTNQDKIWHAASNGLISVIKHVAMGVVFSVGTPTRSCFGCQS